MPEMNAAKLLDGPRGRRFCAEVANKGHYAWCDPKWYEDLWEERKRRSPRSVASSTNPNAPPPPPPKEDFSEIASISQPALM